MDLLKMLDELKQPDSIVSNLDDPESYDALQDAMYRAWNNKRQWQRVVGFQDGIRRVICIQKTGSRTGMNYWSWGYMLTTGNLVWRNTRYPY